MKLLKNIIFSGGGFKCWAYIGTIRALNENVPFDKIKNASNEMSYLWNFIG